MTYGCLLLPLLLIPCLPKQSEIKSVTSKPVNLNEINDSEMVGIYVIFRKLYQRIFKRKYKIRDLSLQVQTSQIE